MSEKFAEKLKKRMAEVRKEQKQDRNTTPARKVDLFRESNEKEDKPVRH